MQTPPLNTPGGFKVRSGVGKEDSTKLSWRIAGFFRSKPKDPEIPVPADQTKAAWWSIFTNLIEYSIDDSEDLRRYRDPDFARSLAQAAANIADAALEVYEKRWGL